MPLGTHMLNKCIACAWKIHIMCAKEKIDLSSLKRNIGRQSLNLLIYGVSSMLMSKRYWL